VHALVGPNGGGKSSLIKTLLGQMPHQGQLSLHWPGQPGTIGCVPQALEFDRGLPMTVDDFMAAMCQRRPAFLGLSKHYANAIGEALERVGMQDKRKRRMGALSGGERQRVLLAQGLIPAPQLLVLDEPMSALDEAGSRSSNACSATGAGRHHRAVDRARSGSGAPGRPGHRSEPPRAVRRHAATGADPGAPAESVFHPSSERGLMSYEAFRLMVQGWASSGYLPEALAYGFVVNALLAGLLIGPVLGGLGTLVVVKRFAFFSEAVGHAALTGVAIGILLGEPYTGPYGSLFGYCLLFGILLNYLRNRTGLAPDTLIGVFLSVSLALGASLLLILAGKINVHILENVLFGSVLTVNGNDLLVLAIVGSLVMALALPLYNRIMLASFNPQLAAVRGVAVKTLDYLFVILVTLITVAAVKVIGAILVGALLVIPAAAARLLSQSLKGFFWCSVLIATVSTLCGILAPIIFDLPIPSGAAIILVAGIAFALAAIARGFSESEREPG
jgi:zinc transport system permease protein